MIFEKKKLLNTKWVLFFSTSFVWNISHSKKSTARYDQKSIPVFMQSTRYSCPKIVKIEFSWNIFEKYSNIKFHENTSSGSRVVECWQTDSNYEANSRFSQFCVRAYKLVYIWNHSIHKLTSIWNFSYQFTYFKSAQRLAHVWPVGSLILERGKGSFSSPKCPNPPCSPSDLQLTL